MSAKAFLANAKRKKDWGKRIDAYYIQGEGKFTVMIMPNQKDPSKFPHGYTRVHFGFTNPDSEEGKQGVYQCNGENDGCPMCHEHADAKANGDSDAWRIQAKSQFTYYVLDGDTLKYMSVDGKLHDVIKREIIAKAEADVWVLDPQEGYRAVITVLMDTMPDGKRQRSYSCSFIKGSPASAEAMKTFKEAKPLSEIQRAYTNEELQMVIEGKSLRKPKPQIQKPEPVQKSVQQEMATTEEGSSEEGDMSENEILARVRARMAAED